MRSALLFALFVLASACSPEARPLDAGAPSDAPPFVADAGALPALPVCVVGRGLPVCPDGFTPSCVTPGYAFWEQARVPLLTGELVCVIPGVGVPRCSDDLVGTTGACTEGTGAIAVCVPPDPVLRCPERFYR